MRLERLYDVRWELLRHVTFNWIDRLDKQKIKRPVDVIAGLGVLFLLVCERFDLNPREVLTVADRVLRRAREVTPQYPRAMETWLREEVPDA